MWEHTKNGNFSVKSVYFVALFAKFPGQVISREFELWGKVWGLNIPPTLGFLIWKVLHRFIAVKEVLSRRNLEVNMMCPICGLEQETIEHLFFLCDSARRVWRASTWGWILQSVLLRPFLNGLVSGSPRYLIQRLIKNPFAFNGKFVVTGIECF